MEEAKICFDDRGCGYIYYPSGRVAIAVSSVNNHQNCYYAYADNQKSKMLLGMDGNGHGFASTLKTKKNTEDIPNYEVVCLSSSGGLYGKNGCIVNEWQWTDNRNKYLSKHHNQSIKKQLSKSLSSLESIDSSGYCPKLQLNNFLSVQIKGLDEIWLSFQCGSVSYECNIGLHQHRVDNYLEHSIKQLDGTLTLRSVSTRPTLTRRQQTLSESFTAQRNKLRPKSENMSEMVRDIVASLERSCDQLKSTITSTSSLVNTWKSNAFETTVSELPPIRLTGTESGTISGLGEHIYISTTPKNNLNQNPKDKPHTLNRLLTSKNEWKTDVAVRETLLRDNPMLKRSYILSSNSGRYVDTLVVNSHAVTPTNPTGMITVPGLPLKRISWEKCKEMVGYVVPFHSTLSKEQRTMMPSKSNHSNSGSSSSGSINYNHSKLTVVLVIRRGDVACNYSERIAEIVNETIQDVDDNSNNSSSSRNCRYELYEIDAGKHNDILHELQIKSLPTFLMFQNTKLVYSGSIQGKKIHMRSLPVQILVIGYETCSQVEHSKVLKKCGCEAYYCNSIREALDRVIRIMTFSPPDLILIPYALYQTEIGDLGNTGNKAMVLLQKLQALGYDGQPIPIVLMKPRDVNHSSSHSCSFNSDLIMPSISSKIIFNEILVPLRMNEVSRLLQNLSFHSIPSNLLKKSSESILSLKSMSASKSISMRKDVRRYNEMGLSPNILLQKMNEVYNSKDSSSFSLPGISNSTNNNNNNSNSSYDNSLVGIKLSAEDITLYSGDKLVSNQ